MTTDQLRIAIATDQGWMPEQGWTLIDGEIPQETLTDSKRWMFIHQLPDYPTDYNAMIPVIRGMEIEKQIMFAHTLVNLMRERELLGCIIVAPCELLAEAYAKAQGIWTD